MDFYRARFEHYGHGPAAHAIVGLGGQAFVAKKSQDAWTQYRPYFEGYSGFRGASLEQFAAGTPLSIGSPQEIIDKTLTFRDTFGDYQRQLWALDILGLPHKVLMEQLELLGTEAIPTLRKEFDSHRAPGVPTTPTHQDLVRAKYGDAEPRQPRPHPNRGDNLSGVSPYPDNDMATPARFPPAV